VGLGQSAIQEGRAGRNFVELGDRFVKDVDGSLENAAGQDESWGENQRLKEAVARKLSAQVAIFRGEFPGQMNQRTRGRKKSR